MISLLFSSNPIGSDNPSAPAESSVIPAASMNTPRSGQTATLLPAGQVLIAGGMNGNDAYFETTEIYDPSANRFVEAMSKVFDPTTSTFGKVEGQLNPDRGC